MNLDKTIFWISAGSLTFLIVLAFVGIVVGWWAWLIWIVNFTWAGTNIWRARKKVRDSGD